MSVGYATWQPDNSATVTALTTTGGTTQATGSTFLVLVDIRGGTLETAVVTDSKGNTYVLASTLDHNFGLCRQGVYLCINGIGGAAHTATATWTGTHDLNTVAFVEYTAIGAGTLDSTPAGVENNSGSPIAPPSITTTVANELVVDCFVSAGSQNETVSNSGAPWSVATFQDTNAGQNGAISYQVVSTSGSTVADSFTFSGFDFTGALAISIKPAAGGGVAINVPLGTLALSGKIPTVGVTANKIIAVPAGALSLTARIPAVLTPVVISVPAGSLNLTAQTPSVATTANLIVAVPKGSLALAGQIPTVSATANQTVAVPAGALSLNGFAPTILTSGSVTVNVPAGTLSLTGLVPTVLASANQTVLVPAGALSLAGLVPQVFSGTTISVPLGQLVLNGLVPNIGLTQNVTIDVPLGQLQLTALPPVVLGASISQAGPVDSRRIADTAFRRKKKLRKIEAPAEPVSIALASFEREIPTALIVKAQKSFQSLVELVGKPPQALHAQVDHELESLMRAADERDDEEALRWILNALEQE